MSLPRGIRNNNPGNIRWGSEWQGLLPESEITDRSFCQFVDPVYGIRAIVKVLFTYKNKYKLNTIEGIINRYAPPNENNTQGYIQRVCNKLGVQKDEPIELLHWIIKAICGVENGNDYTNYYPRELIEQAIKLARS